MIWVGEGNHGVSAWRHHIGNVDPDDLDSHYSIDCIFLNPTRIVGILLDAMHSVNIYNIGIVLSFCIFIFKVHIKHFDLLIALGFNFIFVFV